MWRTSIVARVFRARLGLLHITQATVYGGSRLGGLLAAVFGATHASDPRPVTLGSIKTSCGDTSSRYESATKKRQTTLQPKQHDVKVFRSRGVRSHWWER